MSQSNQLKFNVTQNMVKKSCPPSLALSFIETVVMFLYQLKQGKNIFWDNTFVDIDAWRVIFHLFDVRQESWPNLWFAGNSNFVLQH